MFNKTLRYAFFRKLLGVEMTQMFSTPQTNLHQFLTWHLWSCTSAVWKWKHIVHLLSV